MSIFEIIIFGITVGLSYGLSFACFDKILNNADAWFKTKVDSNKYGKFNFILMILSIVILIAYVIWLIFIR